jgi:hypothetical protein
MASFSEAVADLMQVPKDYQSAAPDDIYARGVPVGPSTDLDRILALPRRPPLDLNSAAAEAMVELEMEKYAIDNPNCDCKRIDPRRPCIKRLLPVQAWMLREISMCQGLLAHVPTGAGKTLIDIVAALALRDCPRPLLLIPASLVDQIVVDYQMISQHFRTPGLNVHAGTKSPQTMLVEGMPTLNVLPYSRLSLEGNSDVLGDLNPTAIISDECDAIRGDSARTRRILSFFSAMHLSPEQRAERRKTKLCAWTGTLTDHSILEFGNLSLLALRDRSPVPLVKDTQEEWARCLDPSESPSPPGELLKLGEPGEDVRHAFRRRLADTLGFIVSTENSVMTATGDKRIELIVRERAAPVIPDIIEEALAKVRMFQRPDTLIGGKFDDEIEDPMRQARCAAEVASGVLYRWKFPPIKGVPQQEDTINEWYAARKLWNKEVRLKCIRGETHLDSPGGCETAAKRAWGEMDVDPRKPVWKSENWPRWRDIKDKVKPVPEAKRLHPYLAEDAARWGLENKGIIWYGMSEFGRWVAELSGLTMHTGGQGAGSKLRNERGDKSIIVSIESHSRGRDGLQHLYDQQLIANTMASSTRWEQLLARVFRRGQKSEVVTTEVYLHTPELRKSFDQAMRRSEYVEDVLGSRQKLVTGWRKSG